MMNFFGIVKDLATGQKRNGEVDLAPQSSIVARDLLTSDELAGVSFSTSAVATDLVSGLLKSREGRLRKGLKLGSDSSRNESKELLERFVTKFYDKVDPGVLELIIKRYYPQTQMLTRVLDRYEALLSSMSEATLRVPFRAALKVGDDNNENLIQIIDAFSQIALRPMLLTERNLPHTVEFIRGLVFHGWDISASLMMLDDAVNKQRDLTSTLRRCAVASTLVATERRQWWDRSEISVPPLLESLSMDTLDDRLAQLGEDLTRYCLNRKIPAASILSQYAALCEVSRCLSDESHVEVIEEGVRAAMGRRDSPETILRHLFAGISRRVDNVGVCRIVERMADARTSEEIKGLVSQLRSTYNSDVLGDHTAVTERNARLAKRQVEIFGQSVADLRGLVDNSRLIEIYRNDLRDMPSGELGLLARFGSEVGRVNKIHLPEHSSHLPGIKIDRLRPEFLFSLDTEHEDWFAKYRSVSGWSKVNLDHFMDSELLFLPNAFAISVPSVKQFSIDNVPMSMVYFSSGQENLGRVPAVYVATEVLESAIRHSLYSALDVPEHCAGLKAVPEADLTPHGLAALAAHEGLPFFNVGTGAVVGGHSNAADLDRNALLEFARDYNKFGEQKRDGWGYVKKVALLEKSELYEPLAALHDQVHQAVTGYNHLSRIVANRFAAWKRGITPVNRTFDVVDWMDQLPPDKLGMRMLFDTFKWHAELTALERPTKEFPKLAFVSLKDLKSGPIEDFYIDAFDLSLHFNDEVWPLKHGENVGSVYESSDYANQFCFSPTTMELWMLEIQPRLAGLMPSFVFEG